MVEPAPFGRQDGPKIHADTSTPAAQQGVLSSKGIPTSTVGANRWMLYTCELVRSGLKFAATG